MTCVTHDVYQDSKRDEGPESEKENFHMAVQFFVCLNIQSSLITIIMMTGGAGPQSKNWSDQQNTSDPTGSIHKKARGKKFDPKKVDFDEGDCT